MSDRSPWLSGFIAHRGLHGEHTPENTVAAFEAAIAAGLAIELDVRQTMEGALVVFHDRSLYRLTGQRGRVRRLDKGRLETVSVEGHAVLTLGEVLAHLQGRTPVVVEGKVGVGVREFAKAFLASTEGYEGELAFMSMNPRAVKLVGSEKQYPVGVVTRGLRRGPALSMLVEQSEAHFVAHEWHSVHTPGVQRLRSQGVGVLTWTVRRESELLEVQEWVDGVLVEGEAALIACGRVGPGS